MALGITPKGSGDFKLAVRVQKRALEQGREVELITKQAKGELDLRYIGEVAKRATSWMQQRQRPLLIRSLMIPPNAPTPILDVLPEIVHILFQP